MKRIESFACRSVCALLLAAFVGAGCSEDPAEPSKPDKEDPAETPDPAEKTDYASINRWMFDYMKTYYLWNEAVRRVSPDYSLGYEKFLNDILEKVAAQNDVNHDDGHWEGGTRSSFYSNIRRYKKTKAETRGTRETADGLGIEMMFYTGLGRTGGAPYAFLIAAVAPGSPADKAGLKRGDLISRVDGSAITDQKTLNAGWEKLMATESGTVRMTKYDLNTGKDGDEISVTAAPYADNPVWTTKTVSTADGKKVGYLCYGSFNLNYDDELIEAFRRFREGGESTSWSSTCGTTAAGTSCRAPCWGRSSREKRTKAKSMPARPTTPRVRPKPPTSTN